MRAVLIDDEQLCIQHLKETLEKNFDMTITGTFLNPNDAIAFLKENDADIVFLDIQMPEKSGLELAEILLEFKPYLNIVFVTAYDDFAVRAFELNALDYIMKPVTKSRLMKTLQRIKTEEASIQIQENSEPGLYKITMLQKFSIIDQKGQPVSFKWRTAKAEQLFLYLLHHRRKVVMKSEIIELLWPNFSQSDASAQLYTTIYHIRKTLKAVNNHIKIKNTAKGYLLILENILIDVDEFEQHLKSGRVISSESLSELDYYLELFKGEYLQDYDYPWLEAEQRRLQMLWVETALNLVDWYYKEKQYMAALEITDEICRRYPLEEEAYYASMKINAKLGNSLLVHIQYKRLKKVYKEELNDVPSSYISEWYENWTKSVI